MIGRGDVHWMGVAGVTSGRMSFVRVMEADISEESVMLNPHGWSFNRRIRPMQTADLLTGIMV